MVGKNALGISLGRITMNGTVAITGKTGSIQETAGLRLFPRRLRRFVAFPSLSPVPGSTGGMVLSRL